MVSVPWPAPLPSFRQGLNPIEAAPPAGLSGLLGGINDWRGKNRNLLVGIGADLLSGNWGSHTPQGSALDQAQQEKIKAEAKAAEQQNATLAYFAKKYPDLAEAVKAGMPIGEAWQTAMDREKPGAAGVDGVVVGDKIIDRRTGKVIYTPPDVGGAGGGPYDGTSMDAQNWNIVLSGDPASPEYAAAYSQLTAPKMSLEQTDAGLVPVWTSPQLPKGIRPPMGAQGPGAPSPVQSPMIGSSGIGPTSTAAPAAASPISMGTALPGTTKPLTESQSKDLSFASRAVGAAPTLDQIGNKLTSLKEYAAGQLGPFGGYLQSEDYQLADQAGREFLAALLRKDSGATITPDEMSNYGSIYLPQPGDKPAVIEQKKAARARAIEAIKKGLPPDAVLKIEQNVIQNPAAPGSDPEIDAILKGYGI